MQNGQHTSNQHARVSDVDYGERFEVLVTLLETGVFLSNTGTGGSDLPILLLKKHPIPLHMFIFLFLTLFSGAAPCMDRGFQEGNGYILLGNDYILLGNDYILLVI